MHFLKKFHCFTKDHFEVAIKGKFREVKTLFPLTLFRMDIFEAAHGLGTGGVVKCPLS